MKELQRRVAALEQLMAPGVPWDLVGGYVSAQMQAMEWDLDYPPVPPGLEQYGHLFMWGSTPEEWEQHLENRAADYDSKFGAGASAENKAKAKVWRDAAKLKKDNILDPNKS